MAELSAGQQVVHLFLGLHWYSIIAMYLRSENLKPHLNFVMQLTK